MAKSKRKDSPSSVTVRLLDELCQAGEANHALGMDRGAAVKRAHDCIDHVLARADGSSQVPVARARLINVFTRYDPDPARRARSGRPRSAPGAARGHLPRIMKAMTSA